MTESDKEAYNVTDINNRKTRFTKDDFLKEYDKYFICSFNGEFARIINMKLIKGLIFRPCPWNDTYKDQVLFCYFDEKKYEEDLNRSGKERFLAHNHDTLITGLDVFQFIECFKTVNEDLANEIGLIIELRKDEGRF